MNKFIIGPNWVADPPTHWRYFVYQETVFYTHEAAEAEIDRLNNLISGGEHLSGIVRLQDTDHKLKVAALTAEVARLREALEQIMMIAAACDTELGAPIDKCWDIAHEALAQEVEKPASKFIIETNWVEEQPTHWRYLVYQDAEFYTHEAAEAECDVLNAIVASDETLHADVFRLQAKVKRLREALERVAMPNPLLSSCELAAQRRFIAKDALASQEVEK